MVFYGVSHQYISHLIYWWEKVLQKGGLTKPGCFYILSDSNLDQILEHVEVCDANLEPLIQTPLFQWTSDLFLTWAWLANFISDYESLFLVEHESIEEFWVTLTDEQLYVNGFELQNKILSVYLT